MEDDGISPADQDGTRRVSSPCPSCGAESHFFDVRRVVRGGHWGRTLLITWVCSQCRAKALSLIFSQDDAWGGVGIVTRIGSSKGRNERVTLTGEWNAHAPPQFGGEPIGTA